MGMRWDGIGWEICLGYYYLPFLDGGLVGGKKESFFYGFLYCVGGYAVDRWKRGGRRHSY